MAEIEKDNKFLTQSELAKRWRLTQTTVKNLRDRGQLPYFRLPGSSRVLYPIAGIKELEELHTVSAKEVDKKKQSREIKRKPDVSATPKKEWRV